MFQDSYMKLLAKIRDQIQKEQQKISNEFARLLGFQSIHDTSTVIPRENGQLAVEWLKNNRTTIEDNFPREATKKLRQLDQDYPDADVITCFRQLVRCARCRLISRKQYTWNTSNKSQSYVLQYKILSDGDPHAKPPAPPPVSQPPVKRAREESTTQVLSSQESTTQVLSSQEPNTQEIVPPPVKRAKTEPPLQEVKAAVETIVDAVATVVETQQKELVTPVVSSNTPPVQPNAPPTAPTTQTPPKSPPVSPLPDSPAPMSPAPGV